MTSTQSSQSVGDNVEGVEEHALDSIPTSQCQTKSSRSIITAADLNDKAPSSDRPSSSSSLN